MFLASESLVPIKFDDELIVLGCSSVENFKLQHTVAYAVLQQSVENSPLFSKLVEDADSYNMALLAIIGHVMSTSQLSINEIKQRMQKILKECYRDRKLWPTRLIEYQTFNSLLHTFAPEKYKSDADVLELTIDSLASSPPHHSVYTLIITYRHANFHNA